jgi:hypothetical protein
MPEVNFPERKINFTDEDFQDIGRLRYSLVYLQGIMFFPDDFTSIEDYVCGTGINFLKEVNASPEEWHSYAMMNNHFAYVIGTRSREAEDRYNECWKPSKIKKGYNLHEKGLVTGKFFHLYIPWRKNKETVYQAIINNPQLLPTRKGEAFNTSSLKKIWENFKYSSHYWAAYLDYFRQHHSDFFEDIWDSQIPLRRAEEKFREYLQSSATCAELLSEKKNPDSHEIDKIKGTDYEVKQPKKIWTALYNGIACQAHRGILVIHSISLKEAIDHEYLHQTDNGSLVSNDPSILFSHSSGSLIIYKIIKKNIR